MAMVRGLARTVKEIAGRESWLVRRLRPAYENYLDWSTGGRGIPWAINGVTCRIDPHVRHRLGSHYEADVAAFLRGRIRPGAVCLDVGANVGAYVLQLAHWSRPDGCVVAFEPNPGAVAVLQRHVAMNDLGRRVTIVQAAVGAEPGQAVLYGAGADGMSRLGAPNEALAGQVTEMVVPVVSLDDYCVREDLAPDWMLIDIEGFELDALEGARHVIVARAAALNIVVEMHPDVWPGGMRQRFERFLTDSGLQLTPLTGQADPLATHGAVHLRHA